MEKIAVQIKTRQSIEKVWEYWTKPEHIQNWNFASDEWHCPAAINDLRPGGNFSWRMEAKDGSMGFDFSGKYIKVIEHEMILLVLDDGRDVSISFIRSDGVTEVSETFEPDKNDPELQRKGWQAILDNFKKYVESE